MESLKKPNLSFYSITAPGVNVRCYRDPKAPRLGYFKTRPGYEEEGYWLQSEDVDIDTQVFTRTFMPWHPEQGDVFASSTESYDPEGWTEIIVDNFSYEPVVSSKFVRQMQRDPLVSVEQISNEELRSRVHKMSSTNYPGLWLMIGDLPDCGEPPLLMGKEIDGMVIFKWILGWPCCSGEKGKRIHIDESNFVFFGEELTKNGYELDLSKINDNDLETLLKVAEPIMSEVPILVNIHEKGVRTFTLPKL